MSPAASSGLRIAVGAATDPGSRREVNEDAALASRRLVVVADGMGGHLHGARASAAVIRAFEPLVGRDDLQRRDISAAVARAHDEVRSLGGGERHAGSTLTGVAVVAEHGRQRWLVFNVGDSRVYRFRDGRLDQLTVDHSLVEEMLSAGEITPAQAAAAPGRNVITRAVGTDLDDTGGPGLDLVSLPILTGDRLLVCSDGLTKELNDDVVAHLLGAEGDPQGIAQELVDQALAAGGRDNVTVVVVDVVEGPVTGPDHDQPEETTLAGERKAKQ